SEQVDHQKKVGDEITTKIKHLNNVSGTLKREIAELKKQNAKLKQEVILIRKQNAKLMKSIHAVIEEYADILKELHLLGPESSADDYRQNVDLSLLSVTAGQDPSQEQSDPTLLELPSRKTCREPVPITQRYNPPRTKSKKKK
ncbi:hypothetical protein BaRGS_00034573, partial [Batillaria attramentaria]